MIKKLKDFTAEELIDKAIGGFGEQNTEENAKFEDLRHALYAVLNFKLSKEQAKLNESMRSLTKRLLWLTWVLVALTAVMLIRMFF